MGESGKKSCCSSAPVKDAFSGIIVPAAVATAVVLGGIKLKSLIKDFCDAKHTETTLAMIKPDAVSKGYTDAIKADMKANGFKIVACKEITFTSEMVDEFYAEHVGKSFYPGLKGFMTSGPAVALILQRVGAITAWRALMGPTNTLAAKTDAPKSMRAQYGTDGSQNACHGSDSPASAAREIAFHFPSSETTLAMIKPDAVERAGEIKAKIKAAGFEIVNERNYTLSAAQVDIFYEEHVGRPFFPALKGFMTSGPVIALALRKTNAILDWRKLMGPTNTATAKVEAPTSLRAIFGTDNTKNATHGSDSPDSAARELYFHFPPVECTLAMIKPDAVAADSSKAIKAKIKEAGFQIVTSKKCTLLPEQVDVFYEEHLGRPFFPALKEFMTSGPIEALALRRAGAVAEWRKLMGPTNTATAKVEAPDSLRALYGTDNTKNATHGSDSNESAGRELSFHFPKMAQSKPFWGFSWF